MTTETKALTPWAVHLIQQLEKVTPFFELQLDTYTLQLLPTNDTLAICMRDVNGTTLVFRTAYSPAGELRLIDSDTNGQVLQYRLESPAGTYTVDLDVQSPEHSKGIHYTVHFVPNEDLHIPFWPNDLLVLDRDFGVTTEGRLHVVQKGIRSGLAFFSIAEPAAGSILYFQNLSALNSYCTDTGASMADVIAGDWPELGFALPPAEAPIKEGKSYCISDAFIAFAKETPANQFEVARQFIDLLSRVYVQLPQPATHDQNYPILAKRTLKDLGQHKGCWSYHDGHAYLNAYVCDYKTPPDIMVQLSVLLPLLEYQAWADGTISIVDDLRAGLPNFFDNNIGVVSRWLPAARGLLDGSEEHKEPLVMDSWYLHHPLLNLSRMALRGDETAKELFLKSADYAIRVAHHFDYQWPVFYKMDTLEVLKPETEPGKGGEKDVAGIYAHVMLQGLELTGDQRFLNEAKRAAQSLL